MPPSVTRATARPTTSGGVLLSTRRSRLRMSYALTYEFEDVASELLGLTIKTVCVPTEHPGRLAFLARHTPLLTRGTSARARAGSRVPFVLAVGQSPQSLLDHLPHLPLIDRAGLRVAVIDELWRHQLPLGAHLRAFLDRFDHVVLGCSDTCEALAASLRTPVSYLPHGLDVHRFVTGATPRRAIDAYAMGRRNPAHHRVLLDRAEATGGLYLYDSFAQNPAIHDYRAHRQNLIGLIRRSQVFLVNPAKVDRTEQRGEQFEVGYRYFEGAAGGAVLVGARPATQRFDELFPYDDALVTVADDGSDLLEKLEKLGANQHRMTEISHTNVTWSLRHHDVSHRLRTLFARLEHPEPEPLRERIDGLGRLAARLESN